MLTADKLELLHSAFFKNISESSCLCFSDEVLSLIDSLPTSISEISGLLRSESQEPSWNLTSLCLLHLSCLQNLCQRFSAPENAGLRLKDRLLNSEILKNTLLNLVVVKPIILRHAAIKTVTKLMLALSASQTSYNGLLDAICDFISNCCDDTFFLGIDIITSILNSRQKLNEVTSIIVLSPKLIGLLQKSSLLVHKNRNNASFVSYCDLLNAAFMSGEIPKDLLIENSKTVLLDFCNAYKWPLVRTKYLKLVKSILPVSIDTIANSLCVKNFAENLLSAMVEDIPKSVRHEPGAHGFGGAKHDGTKNSCSSSDVMLMINVLLNCVAITNCGNSDVTEKVTNCIKVMLLVESKIPEDSFLENELLEFYFEQDDLLIEFLLLHLLICTSCLMTHEHPKKFILSPHQAFLSLLRQLAFDSSILLDWLTSNETQFLLYFIKYMKYSLKTQGELLAACRSCNAEPLNEMFSTLKTSIERLTARNLFPYSAKPLIRNITLFLGLLKPV